MIQRTFPGGDHSRAGGVGSPLDGPDAGDLLREAGLEQSLVPSDGEPLTYHAGIDADLLVRPFYAFKQGEPYYLYLDPNRRSHRDAQFSGDGWRDPGLFASMTGQDRLGEVRSSHGTGIRWIGYRFDDAGIAELRVDGQAGRPGSTSTPQRGQPFDWRKEGLPAGRHLLTITILDEKPERSKGHFTNVAGFEVIP